MDQYIGWYIIDKVVFINVVKLWLLTLMRIHPVVNVSEVIWYKKQVEGQKTEEVKLVEIEKVEEWEVEKLLNKKYRR